LPRRSRDRMTRSNTFCRNSGLYGNRTMHRPRGSNSRPLIGEKRRQAAPFDPYGKVRRRQQTGFVREFAETEFRGNDADPEISGHSVPHPPHGCSSNHWSLGVSSFQWLFSCDNLSAASHASLVMTWQHARRF
jgi:hypothetical protein